MEDDKKALLILRVFLFCAGFGWVISVFGVFMPWSFVVEQLQGLGAENLPSDPMLNYWLRMTAGAFTFIGLFFIVLGLRPVKYAVMIPFAVGFLFFEGCVLLGACLLLHLPLLPSVFDSVFCLFMAAGIFLSNRAVGQYSDNKESPAAMAV